MKIAVPLFSDQLRLRSELNQRDHPMIVHNRKKGQQKAVAEHFALALQKAKAGKGEPLPELPVHVRLVRTYGANGKPMDDHDNLRSSLKAVVDEVARVLQVDDKDSRVSWSFDQRRVDTREACSALPVDGVLIEITAAEPPLQPAATVVEAAARASEENPKPKKKQKKSDE